jgi:uncharacterized phage protein gp47/JayE
MPNVRPNLSQLRSSARAAFAAKLPGADTTLRRSNITVSADTMAGFVNGEYGYLDYVFNQMFLSHGATDPFYIGVQGAEYGMAPAAATQAAGNAIFTGTSGTDIPNGTLLEDSLQNEYATQADVSIGGGGYVTVAIEAVEGGAAQNLAPGAPLTLVNAIAGVNATANVDGSGLSGGTDAQTPEAFAQQILARKRQPPQGGTENDYVTWAKQVPGVTRAWALPLNRGPGTIDVSFVMDGRVNIIPLSGDLAAVQAWINGHTDQYGNIIGRPVTDDCVVFAPTPSAVNFTITGVSTANQPAVTAALKALMATTAIGGGLSFQDQIIPAVAGAAGTDSFAVTAPSSDVAGVTGELLTMGTITW